MDEVLQSRKMTGQSLKGKRFLVYQLFQAENAKGMESINYTFNPEYKKFVCYIVGQRIHKDERNVQSMR